MKNEKNQNSETNIKTEKKESFNVNLDSLKKSIESKKDLKDRKKNEIPMLYKKEFQDKKIRLKIRRELTNILNDLISKDRNIEDRKNAIISFKNWSEKYLNNPISDFSKLKVSDFSNAKNEEKKKDLELFVEIFKESIK